MAGFELTAEGLARIAGWQVMKEARAILAAGRVQESSWSPPRLTGTVREGTSTYRSGLVLPNAIDVDNLCSCRRARSEGTSFGGLGPIPSSMNTNASTSATAT